MKRTHALLALPLGVFSVAGLACGGEDPPPVVVDDPIEITTTSLPGGQEGEPYSAEIMATGGSGEGYRWSVIGSLPAGLFMSSRGDVAEDGTLTTTILGTPQVNGEFSFTVRLTDEEGDFGSADLSISLDAPPPALTIVTDGLPDGGTETAYDAQLEAENGEQPYTWVLAGGALPAGITLSDTGALSGMPEEPGEASFTVQVNDAAGARATADFTITVQDESLPLAMVTTDLPDGVVELEYTAALEAENGSPPYTWSILGDGPPGLEVAPSEGNPVELTGTPTLQGSYTFQVEVEDSEGARVTRTFFVEIERAPPPLRIITLELPAGEVNSPYDATVSGLNGSNSGYEWSVSAGALPPGLTLAPSGTPDTTLSGTPSASGDFTFTIQVQDDQGRTDETEFSVTIIPEIFPVEITTTSTSGVVTLPTVRLGETYDETITAQNGFGGYHWVVSAGRLPAGLEVEVAGTPDTRITGLAGERGTFDFTVTVYDDNNQTDSQDFTLFVDGPEFPVNIVTTSVPDARACNGFNADIVARQGSNVDYQWSISAGSLPPGITIDPSGTPATRLRGTAIAGTTGTYNFTVQVTDSAGDTFTQSYSMDVVDDGTGDRWMVMVGDLFTDNRYDVAVTNVCQATPSAAVQVSPSGTTGDADTGSLDFEMSPDGTKIAFTGDFRAVGRDEVWVVDISSGTPTTPVIVSPTTGGTSGSYDAFDLKWAPNGNWLAFSGDMSSSSRNELYVVDTSGTIAANSAIPVGPTPPSYADVDSYDYWWSPDSRWLAWTQDTGGSFSRYEGWLFDTNTPTARSGVRISQPLPSTSADVNTPMVFSPDSTSLVYNCDCETVFQDELWEIDLTGTSPSAPRAISHNFTSGDVRWTSSYIAPPYHTFTDDGAYLIYRSDGGNTSGGDLLYATDMSSPTARGVAVHPSLGSSAQDLFYMRPAGGSKVVAMGDMDVSSRNELFLFDLSLPFPQDVTAAKISGAMQPNGDVGSYTDFEVSPDGSYVVFSADKVTEGHEAAFLVDLNNPLPEPVQLNPVIADSNRDVFDIVWSPASNYVGIYGDLRLNGVNELWAVDVAAGAPYNWIKMGPNLGTSQDINSPVRWRGDGGGVVVESDITNVGRDEPFWISVDDPTTATSLAPNIPSFGDVFYIKQQGREYGQ